MIEKNFILATAGHIDHGKSALVKALTGTDPDRLPEEKARGITIDLGFAHLSLPGPLSTINHQPSTFSVGVVDVPGHQDFVRNMIAGVGAIDLALFAVAANEGWMPQTEEHLQILSYLGVQRLVVALTKSDIAEPGHVRDQVREELQETPFSNAAIIPTSVRTGAGIEDLKNALAHEYAALLPPLDIGKARLFVDRAFSLRGIGTVVTGTLMGGAFHVGDNVFIEPANISTRIRSLQSHGQSVDVVQPGTRTAINLPDLHIETDVKRGDVITSQHFEPVSTLDIILTRSTRLKRVAPIKAGTSAYVHHGTRRVFARIILAETNSLATGESGIAQLRLNAPLLAFVGDRLIIRDASEQQTIGGGLVFNFGDLESSQERALVASRAVAPNDVALAVWTEIGRGNFMEPSRVLERSRFSAAEISTGLQKLAHHGEIFLSHNVAAKMLVWRELRALAAELIDTAHKTHPERRGLELTDLRAELKALSPDVFDALTSDLCQTEFVRAGSTVARAAHRPSLPPELKPGVDKIHAALAAKPFDPPGRKDVAKDRIEQQALKFLVEQGEIVEISEEIVLLRDSAERMQKMIVDCISTKGAATASQLREELGSSRRVIIPFLEYLDRAGVTQRAGDLRKLREPKSTAIARS